MASTYALESFTNLFNNYPFLTKEQEIPLPSSYQSFIHLTHYSRFIPELERRETWQETIFRFLDYINYQSREQVYDLDTQEMKLLYDNITALNIMPSMRLLWSAGDAVKKDAAAAYNCAYCPIDNIRSFDEILYLLMCGCGVGFSVEWYNVSKLPRVPEIFYDEQLVIDVEDSKDGWAKALRNLITILYAGSIPTWNLSQIRPEGSRLKVFGGYASGPLPLDNLFNFIVKTFKENQGQILSSLAVHDIVCMIGSTVVSGGVRRSALISLSDLDDLELRQAKNSDWFEHSPHRSLSNNSAVYHGNTHSLDFEIEWDNLVQSGSGERGIFSRAASNAKVKSLVRRDLGYDWGTNPCSEIILRPRQFCNLAEVVVREHDTHESLKKKIRAATILGTIQSTITNFRYISEEWQSNCEDERLLGVSLTGIADSSLLFSQNGQSSAILESLRNEAISTNVEYAKKLHINRSAAITAIKPSGTVSQLVNSASGMHARYSPFYTRRVRLNVSDPVAQYMVDAGVPCEPDEYNAHNTLVFSFPIKAPSHARFTKDLDALEHAKIWKNLQDNYCEHKPSATLTVRNEEWKPLGKWVEKNLDNISGLSFLPFSEHGYKQAPFEEITEEDYNQKQAEMPEIDWYNLREVDAPDQFGPSSCEGISCSLDGKGK